MRLEELVNIVNETYFEDTSSYKVIMSKAKELLEIMTPSCNIKTIDHKKVLLYRKALKARGNEKATINAKLSYLSKLLSYAYNNRLIDYKPIMPYLKLPAPKNKVYKKEQFILMLLWTRKNREKELQKILLIGYYTGLRINNILSISGANIEEDLLFIYDKKTNSNFYLPLHHKIRYILEGFEGFESNYNHIYYVFGKMKSELGIDNTATIHSLRHTFCTTLNKKGVPLNIIQKLANHKKIQNTMRYTHVDDDQCKSAISML